MTLASHANAALSGDLPLRLPGHPAFLAVRRARLGGDAGGEISTWFARVREHGTRLALADAGLDGAAVVGNGHEAWRVVEHAGAVSLEPAPPCQVTAPALDTATARLRDAVTEALHTAGAAPPALAATLARVPGILASAGTGEELSDVAWPHFLLAAGDPLPARRLAAAAATAWWWDEPGAWAGPAATAVTDGLRDPVAAALVAAVAAHPG